jgi:II/X family phage/plasmid replication protein
LGLPNNAFGSADIRYCATKMIRFAEEYFSVRSLLDGHPDLRLTRSGDLNGGCLPSLESWSCSRIDVTRNYLMQSEAEARQALAYLKQAPESRQKHSFESNGLYIGKRSTLQTGKIYLKGQDAQRCKKTGRAQYTDDQLFKSKNLLRAELSLKRHSLRRLKQQKNLNWYDLTPSELFKQHDAYFSEYFSNIEVTDMSIHLERLLKTSPTEGQARAAYDCYVRIRMCGYEQTKETYPKPSWYRHISNLKLAGFKRADLQMINVIPLKKRAIQVSEPVRHWDDIPSVA